MSRTIKDIYTEAIAERNKRMELTEFNSDSKLSIMNGLTWVVAAIIHSFETLLDVFAVDISNTINNRINGTPVYYTNALLQYQKGNTLSVLIADRTNIFYYVFTQIHEIIIHFTGCDKSYFSFGRQYYYQ